MESLPKNQIIEIAKNIFNESDIIGKHGTSVANAKSIVETGFVFYRTSIAIQNGKSIVGLCSYGWKENAANDATNVIISIPKSFIMMINHFSEDDYKNWIEMVQRDKAMEGLFIAISSVIETREADTSEQFGKFVPPRLPNYMKRHIPKEFIKGFFVWCDGKRYFDYLSKLEESLEHLSYVENPYFFNNLSIEDQEKFVASFTEEKRRSR